MTTYLDEAVGETRLVRLDAEGRPVELRIERWSERDTLAAEGDRFMGRVTSIEQGIGGAFVDLGLERAGFLPFKRGRPHAGLHEGAKIVVEVAAEAAPGKGPRLRREPDAAEDGAAPQRLARAPSLSEGAQDAIVGAEARSAADQAVEAALAQEVFLPDGGSIAIEPTRAMIVIDVDAGRRIESSPERLARATNMAAIDAASRHISLRALSGLVVLDLLAMRPGKDRDALRAHMDERLAAVEVRAEVAPLTRFGVLQLAVERRRRAIHEVLCDADGRPTAETVALTALRRLEDEAHADRGARLVLRAPAAAVAWLDRAVIPWRAALTDRIGARFKVEPWPDPLSDAIEAAPVA